MVNVPKPRYLTAPDRLYLLWFLCIIDLHKETQVIRPISPLSPRGIANRYGERMLNTTLTYMELLAHHKLTYERDYKLLLMPRGQLIVDNWEACRDSILAT
jgi:hypothetical protein